MCCPYTVGSGVNILLLFAKWCPWTVGEGPILSNRKITSYSTQFKLWHVFRAKKSSRSSYSVILLPWGHKQWHQPKDQCWLSSSPEVEGGSSQTVDTAGPLLTCALTAFLSQVQKLQPELEQAQPRLRTTYKRRLYSKSHLLSPIPATTEFWGCILFYCFVLFFVELYIFLLTPLPFSPFSFYPPLAFWGCIFFFKIWFLLWNRS